MQFATMQQVTAYVQQELAAALPAGWTAHVHYRLGRSHLPAAEATIADLEWKIFRPPEDVYDYELHVSGDFGTFTLTYGNSAPGPWRSAYEVYTSLTVFAETLDRWPLRNVLARLLTYPTNRWDLT
jgi:hypothetical protein